MTVGRAGGYSDPVGCRMRRDTTGLEKTKEGNTVRIALAFVTIVALAATLLAGSALAQTPSVTAEVKDAGGKVVGVARFTAAADGVQLAGQVQGLPPGVHGIHIHTVGTCAPPDFVSAGGHFNPTGKKHGTKNAEGHHVGDLPNLTIAADGTGTIQMVAKGATLSAGATSLFDADGSALVIHAGPDDEATDPTGNSGGRIACGVLTQLSAPASSLPRTGDPAVIVSILAGAGALFAAGGVALRRRQTR